MKTWALVIGIDLHPASPELNPLEGAVADATDFAEWALADDGGGVPPNQMYFWSYPPSAATAESQPFVTNYLKAPTPWPRFRGPGPTVVPDPARGPTVGEVTGVVQFLQKKARADRKPAERWRCYVHLAGHGIEIDEETCFLTSDYENDPGMISCARLHKALQSAGFDDVILFLDCCRTHPGNLHEPPRSFKVSKARSLVGLARAAEPGRQSFEFSDEGSPRGAFTHSVTRGLRGHRRQGQLSFADLGLFVAQTAPTLVPQRQRPQFSSEPPDPQPPLVILDDGDQQVLRDIVITFREPHIPRTVVLTDWDGQPFREPIAASVEPVRVLAPVGQLYALGGKPFEHYGPGDKHVTV